MSTTVQPNKATQFVQHEAGLIASEITSDPCRKLTWDDLGLLAQRVKARMKQNFGAREVMNVFWGTRLSVYDVIEGLLTGDWRKVYLFDTPPEKQSGKYFARYYAHLLLCGEVWLRIAENKHYDPSRSPRQFPAPSTHDEQLRDFALRLKINREESA